MQSEVKVMGELLALLGILTHKPHSHCGREQVTDTVCQPCSVVGAHTPSVLRCLVLPRAICSCFFFFFKFPSLPIFTNTKQENLDRIRSHWSDWVLSELSVRRPAHWRMVLGFIRKKKWQLPCTHVSFLLVPGQTCFERLKEVRGPIPSLMRSSSGRPLKLNKGGTLVFTRVTITCHYFELPGADFSTRPKTAAKKGVHLVQLNHCW